MNTVTIQLFQTFQGLVSHRNEANRRLKVEEEEYVHRVVRNNLCTVLKIIVNYAL